ncbi:hypothetical protein IV59_GL000490 [Paucilactobacillus hokkaidonensis]|nr:hypothetical protein IV59_GL000490 [Paucilactobacillus hokkaidonensis]
MLLLILNQILTYSVTPPNSGGQPMRYLLYWLMFLISSIGTNLIVLYLGFTSRQTKNSIKKLSKIYFYLICIGLFGVIFSVVAFKSFASQDLWLLLFPISHNDFPLASSILLWYVFGSLISKYIHKLSQTTMNSILLFIPWLFIFMPFLFGKQLWSIDSGNSFVWVGILFLLGILFGEENILSKIRSKSKIITLVIILLALPLLLKISPLSVPAANLHSRLYSNYSLPMFFISIIIFSLFISFKTIKYSKHKIIKSLPINWLFLSAYFFTQLPTIAYRLSNDLHLKYKISSVKWLLQILIIFLSVVITVFILTFIIEKLSHLAKINKTINNLSISYSDLNRTPYLIKEIFINNWRSLFVILIGLFLTYIQILSVYILTESPFKMSFLKDVITTSSQQILLSTIIFYLFFVLIFGIFNRYWYALIFSTGVFVIISVAEVLKISLRDEPILPADLSMITAMNELLKMVNPIVIIVALIFIIILFVSSILLEKRFNNIYNRSNWKKRVTFILIPLIVFSGSFFINHNNSLPKIVFKAFGVQPLFYDQTGGARVNGPVIQFINNIDTKIMNKPAGYSKKNIEKIMKKYDNSAKNINKTRKSSLSNQTIIFTLSESFSDPNRVPNLKVSPNPIPYLTKLKKQTSSGLMLSSGYGGGTANMEWQSLTGLSLSNLSPTLPTPYTQLVPSQKISPAFTDLFDSKIAIHPFNASLYNRINVFKKFGFNKFYYDGSKYKLTYKKRIGSSPYISDESAYKNTLKIINQKHSGSRFIQLSTMQNHMPFTDYYPNAKSFKISGSAFSKDSKSSIETYSQGLNYTDKSLKKFITKINKIHKPVTIVWYGDHLASLYNKDSMSKYGIPLHETDYFIYNNQTKKITHSNKVVSPYSFSALALKADNIKVSPYYALITNVTEDLPAMTIDPTSSQSNSLNGSNIFVSENGKKIKSSSLTKKQKQLLHDYRLIQYDLTAGKQYSAHWAQQKIK